MNSLINVRTAPIMKRYSQHFINMSHEMQNKGLNREASKVRKAAAYLEEAVYAMDRRAEKKSKAIQAASAKAEAKAKVATVRGRNKVSKAEAATKDDNPKNNTH